MKPVIKEPAISPSRSFIVKDLIAPYFDPNWHFHPEYQLFLVLKGRGTRFVGDNIKPFKEKDMVFTGPNLPHLWRSDDSYFHKKNTEQTHGIVIYFKADFLGGALDKKEEFAKIHHLLQRSARGLEVYGRTRKLVSEYMMELVHMNGIESIITLLKILNLLALAPPEECPPINQSGYVNLNKVKETGRMSKVYDHVMQHFKKKICIQEVAAIANMSPASFSRYFKLRANKSFSSFVCEIRIGHACKKLREEDINISQACYESGFNTLSNFNRKFKEITGKTPFQYRKDYHQMTC